MGVNELAVGGNVLDVLQGLLISLGDELCGVVLGEEGEEAGKRGGGEVEEDGERGRNNAQYVSMLT